MRIQVVALVALLSVACGTSSAPPDEPATEEPTEAAEQETEPIDPIVRDRQEATDRTAPGGEVSISWFAEGNNAYVGELRLEPGTEVPPHHHEGEEYLIIHRGGGVLTIEGEDFELTPGTVVAIPAGHEHSYVNGPEPTVATQIFAGPEGAQRYLDWPEGHD